METNVVIGLFVGIFVAVFISTTTIFFIFRQRYRNLAKQIDEQEIISHQLAESVETRAEIYKDTDSVPPVKQYRVSLWGPKSVGKTTYIAMAYWAGLAEKSRWVMTPDNIESTNFISDNINILNKGGFPLATSPEPEPSLYKFEFREADKVSLKRKTGFLDSLTSFMTSRESEKSYQQARTIVSLADVAGEQFFSESLDHPLWENLATSDGLICLLDPSEAENHFNITFQLLQFLRLKLKDRPNALVNGMLPHYVAFCFSKIDQPEFVRFINKPHDLVLFLEKQTDVNMDKLLLQYFLPDRIKYFTISSIGLQAKVNGSEIENPKNISPINILEPLQWLFRNFEK